MPKKKAKRTNPNKKPISLDSIDYHEVIAEESTGNMYYAWLLVLPPMFEHEGMTKEQVVSLWDAVNNCAAAPDFTGRRLADETTRIEHTLGFSTPYPDIDFDAVRSEGALLAVRRKLKANALHAGLCIIALGIESTGKFTPEEIKRLIFNADLTLAEIQRGCTTYEDLAAFVEAKGIAMREGANDMAIIELPQVAG